MTDKLNLVIHDRLIPIQSKFRSWEQLANNSFRFEPKTFKKAIEAIQEVINITRELAGERKE